MSSTNQAASEPPGRLVSHFRDWRLDDQASGWHSLWESKEESLWDRQQPSAPLVQFLSQHAHSLLKHHGERALRALVPGCGRGYDVITLALHGLNAYGLEVSPTAVATAENYAKNELSSLSAEHFFSHEDAYGSAQCGDVKFVEGNFFARDWEEKCGGAGFDLIYDYTFLCALPPSQRKSWSQRMQQLLGPGGVLVCLEFPLWKPLDAEGPPWGLRGVYWDLLASCGDRLAKEDAVEESADGGDGNAKGPFLRAEYFKPEQSYKQGRGTDMVSVWKWR